MRAFAVLAVAACTTAVAAAPAPAVDGIAWYEALVVARPALMADHDGGVDDPAWQALVIRPRYRDVLLADDAATYATIVARAYRDADRRADARWADALRAAQRAYVPVGAVRPGGYPLEVYASFVVGDAPFRGRGAWIYKAYLEIEPFQRGLSAERLAGYAEALADVGLRGDLKVDLRPGAVRFQYNNVIVHAVSPALAMCAEAVGRSYFGADLAHVGRGVDPVGERVDFHHLLLAGGAARMPDDVRRFVRHEVEDRLADCAQPSFVGPDAIR